MNPIGKFLASKRSAFCIACVGNIIIAVATVNEPLWFECLGCALWCVMIYSWSALLREKLRNA